MSEKLYYNKIAGEALSIDIHNGYSVIVMPYFQREDQKYHVNFYLKDNNVDILDLIDDQKDTVLEVENTALNSTILRTVSEWLNNGWYNGYIKRYDYMLRCFDKGHEILDENISSSVRK